METEHDDITAQMPPKSSVPVVIVPRAEWERQRQRIAALEAMLRRVEFCTAILLPELPERTCPWCGRIRKIGHAADCELAALLPKEARG